jgi:hypothetical protein
MIRAGRLVHQGSVGELRAAQQPQFIVAPERDADLPLLTRLFMEAGCAVSERPAEATVLVQAPAFGAADLNRLAAKGGITLRQLSESTRSLERAFFALTGTASADVPDGQEMGAIK